MLATIAVVFVVLGIRLMAGPYALGHQADAAPLSFGRKRRVKHGD